MNGALSRRLVAFGDDDQEVQVAVAVWLSPSLRSEEDDPFWMELCD